jgi:hypothetical protein
MTQLYVPVLDSTETGPIDEPTGGVQYAVLDKGEHHVYGDQGWIADADVIADEHPNGRIQRRTVTITYGPWEDVPVVVISSATPPEVSP